MTDRILFNLIQVLVVMVFAPLTKGVLNRLIEQVQSKRGPSIFQPYRDIWKLFHKDEVVPEQSSWIFRFTPYIVLSLRSLWLSLFQYLRRTPFSSLSWVICWVADLYWHWAASLQHSPPWTQATLTALWEPVGHEWLASLPSRSS